MKKILAILLSLIIVISCVSVAFAADNEKKEIYPVIHIHGFMAKDLLADKNDRESEVLWPPQTDEILDVVKECLPDILSLLVTKNFEKFKDAIMEPVRGLLSKANLDSDGNPVGTSGVYFKIPDANEIKETSDVDFNYDWRLDPVVIAGQLNDYIDYVLECSGASKVNLECHSFGGIVTETYLKLYGFDKIKGVCYNTTAIFGEQYTGEMLNGDIVVNDKALTEFLKCLLGGNEYSKLINGLFDILYSAGITEDICQLGNDLVTNVGDEIIREIILPMFAGWLSIWAMVPDSYIDGAMEYVFDKLYEGEIAAHQGLYDKITNYNTNVRVDKAEVLKAQNEVCNVYVISRYNRASIPAVPNWQIMSDSVVDSAASSFGAVFANYGEKLDEEFLNGKNEKYINPDRNLYAGDCLFPEQTWFIRDYPHADNDDDLDEMMLTLLSSDEQATCDTFEQYPRFLQFNSSDRSIVPNVEPVPDVKLNIFDKIFNFILKILAFNRSIFEFIFRR